MINTGVFATTDEVKELQALANQAARTPVIAFSSAHALKRGGLSGDMWRLANERCHAIALAHGLPEIQGFYGLTADGEFVRT